MPVLEGFDGDRVRIRFDRARKWDGNGAVASPHERLMSRDELLAMKAHADRAAILQEGAIRHNLAGQAFAAANGRLSQHRETSAFYAEAVRKLDAHLAAAPEARPVSAPSPQAG